MIFERGGVGGGATYLAYSSCGSGPMSYTSTSDIQFPWD